MGCRRWESQPGAAETCGEGREEGVVAMRVLSQQTGGGGAGGAIPEMETWGEFRFGGARFEELTGHRGEPVMRSRLGPHICLRGTRGARTEGKGGARGRIPRKSAPREGPGRGQGGPRREMQKYQGAGRI